MQADGKALPVQAAINHIVVPQPVSDLRFTATGFDDGVLTYYQARYGRQGIQALNDLELVPTYPDGNTFRLMFKGRPVAASQVNVETGGGVAAFAGSVKGRYGELYAILPWPVCA